MWKQTKKLLWVFYKAGDKLVDDDGIEHAGYLTFLGLLALFPFMVLIVSLAGFIGEGELGTQFITYMANALPQEAVDAIMPRIVEIISGPPQGLLTVAVLGAIWTSSSGVEGVRGILNRAYNVSNPPTYILRRLMSIAQILVFTMIIMGVMMFIVFAPLVIVQIEGLLGFRLSQEMDEFWNQSVVYIGAFLLFFVVANIYYILPNIRQRLGAVVPGAALVMVLWMVGASLFTVYISNVDQMNVIYGSLGGFIATLLFLFVMSVIFIYGAEFNATLIEEYGGEVEEIEHVEPEEEVGHAHHASHRDKASEE